MNTETREKSFSELTELCKEYVERELDPPFFNKLESLYLAKSERKDYDPSIEPDLTLFELYLAAQDLDDEIVSDENEIRSIMGRISQTGS